MIGPKMAEMLLENKEHFLIPAEIVAHVQEDNYLDHALLVLSKIGYSKIPVLDNESKLMGLISMPMVTDQMLGLDKIDIDILSEIKVKDVMETDFRCLENPYDLEEVLHLLVDQPFIPIVSDDGSFTGIVTRREMMKSLNRIAHELEKNNDIVEKTIEKKEHYDGRKRDYSVYSSQ